MLASSSSSGMMKPQLLPLLLLEEELLLLAVESFLPGTEATTASNCSLVSSRGVLVASGMMITSLASIRNFVRRDTWRDT